MSSPPSARTAAAEHDRRHALVVYYAALSRAARGGAGDKDKGRSGEVERQERIESLEDLADGEVFARTLVYSDPEHFAELFPPASSHQAAGPTITSTWQTRFRLLKRTYHLLVTLPVPAPVPVPGPLSAPRTPPSLSAPEPPAIPPTHPLAALPTPDLLLLARHTPSAARALPSSAHLRARTARVVREAERLAIAVLAAQAVWGPGNERVIGVIGGLEVGVQRALKGVIEEILAVTGHAPTLMTPRKMRSLGATPQRGTASSPTPRGSAQVLVREDTDVGDDGPDMEDLWLAVREVDAAPHADEGDQEASRTYAVHAERARLIGENEALRSELDARDRERQREQARSVCMGASGGPSRSDALDASLIRSPDMSGSSESDAGPLVESMSGPFEPPSPLAGRLRASTAGAGGSGGTEVVALKEEMARLRSDLSKKDDECRQNEVSLEETIRTLQVTTQRLQEAKAKAVEFAELREELEVLRHASAKLSKAENANDKLKRKLEEAAQARREQRDLEQRFETLEAENAGLREKLDRARTATADATAQKKIQRLDSVVAAKQTQLEAAEDAIEGLRNDVAALQASLAVTQERASDMPAQPASMPIVGDGPAAADQLSNTASPEYTIEDLTRIKIRLELELAAAARVQSSLRSELTEARLRTSSLQGSEAVIALRKRTREAAEEYDALLRENRELSVRADTLAKAYETALADLELVDLDKKDMLDQVRRLTQAENQAEVESAASIKRLLHEAQLQAQAHLGQINELLLQKVDLQSQIIRLQRGDHESGRATKGLSSELKDQLLQLHESNVLLSEQNETLEAKLHSAKRLVKEQDGMIKRAKESESKPHAFEDAERSYKATIESLRRDIEREKQKHFMMLKAWSDLGERSMRQAENRPEPITWLAKQRQTLISASPRRA